MGYFGEYIGLAMTLDQLHEARKDALSKISQLRGGRDILTYAADLKKGGLPVPIHIDYGDLLPFSDQLSELAGNELDFILETPGGVGSVAEDMVHQIRAKYKHVAIIIPGYAKSAGTIIAMSGDEIIMDQHSSLGPIDAQIMWQGKVFSAHALIEGFERIKKEVEETGVLNKAYIPMLQVISPGELQGALNAQDFAKQLVTDWLVKYKFASWDTHSTTGFAVTPDEKEKKAADIAGDLCNHGKWKVHDKSLKIQDLRAMGLKITDLSEIPDLAEAVRRYFVLVNMCFDATSTYKIYETPKSQIFRNVAPSIIPPKGMQKGEKGGIAELQVACPGCTKEIGIQANVGAEFPLKSGLIRFPTDNKLICPSCGTEFDITPVRAEIEAKTGKKLV